MTAENLPARAAKDEARLLAFLEKHGVEAAMHRHRPVFTVEEGEDVKAALPGGHTKNLFLKEKGGGYLLACCFGSRQIRIADLQRAAGAKKLSFASADELEAVLGVTPGSVTIFALLNDQERRVRLILDQGLMAVSPVYFHPLHNAASLAVTPEALGAFLAATGHEPQVIDFDALEALREARIQENPG